MSTEASLKDLVRWSARTCRSDRWAAERLRFACVRHARAYENEPLVTIGASALRRSAALRGVDPSRALAEIGHLRERLAEVEAANRDGLRRLVPRLGPPRQDPAPLLLGDAAVLAALYRDFGVYPVGLWAFAVERPPDRRWLAAAEPALRGAPAALVMRLGRLSSLVGEQTEAVELDGHTWLAPRPTLLVALLASRVGDPLAHPLPAAWPHLAFALTLWRDEVICEEVLELAGELDLRAATERGLAIAGHLFPELRDWAPADRLASLPAWERVLAVPLAARKLVEYSASN